MLFIKLIENDKNNIYKNNELFIKLIENKKKMILALTLTFAGISLIFRSSRCRR